MKLSRISFKKKRHEIVQSLNKFKSESLINEVHGCVWESMGGGELCRGDNKFSHIDEVKTPGLLIILSKPKPIKFPTF